MPNKEVKQYKSQWIPTIKQRILFGLGLMQAPTFTDEVTQREKEYKGRKDHVHVSRIYNTEKFKFNTWEHTVEHWIPGEEK